MHQNVCGIVHLRTIHHYGVDSWLTKTEMRSRNQLVLYIDFGGLTMESSQVKGGQSMGEGQIVHYTKSQCNNL